MTQQNKAQSDKTKNQLVESMQKSKAAGSSPTAGEQASGAAGQSVLKPNTTASGYSLGGLRWPD